MNKPLYVVWTDRNNLDIPIIDEQHRAIVSVINTLHHFIQTGTGPDAVKPVLTMLDSYAALHFKTEEAILKEVGYPGMQAHMLLHQALAERMRAIGREFDRTQDATVALRFLKTWWLDHINGDDKQYAPSVHGKLRSGRE